MIRYSYLREDHLMNWICSVSLAVTLAFQPAFAADIIGPHQLNPQARDAFVSGLLTKMTLDEKLANSG
ncbi:Periplasmic beta-glucosidase [Erwinia amylovora MR1]|nr:Periplasmic beta-glucosidase [Erwinia amylovora MR1]